MPFSIKSFQRKTPPTKGEVQQWLFNDLMGTINPELTSGNRTETASMLSSLSERQLKKRFTQYEKAFKQFVKRWPKYIKEQEKKLKGVIKDFGAKSADITKDLMSDLEDQISSFKG